MKNMTFTIKATPNYSKKTFTIRKYWEDGEKVKYRTLPMNEQDFEEAEFYTSDNWKSFLKNEEGSYYEVKHYYNN